MFAKHNTLGFFLEQQKKLTYINQNNCSLHIKKKLAENFFLKQKYKFNFEHKLENINTYLLIQNYINDQDFCRLFQAQYNNYNFIVNNDIFCIFTSPLQNNWLELISSKQESTMLLRSGFFNNEYEIYESILFGFNGMFIFCQGLDKYKIQYLTETAREYFFTLIFIVNNKKELNTVLETDAPYLTISGYSAHTFKVETSIFYQLSSLIPKTTTLMAWSKKLDESKIKLLNEIGYKVFFEIC